MINPMDDLEGKFVIRDEDELLEFDRCGDLPDTFDYIKHIRWHFDIKQD